METSQEKNYFSEKLIDCLLTETIPIYWGCPNIGDYFDMRGILQFNDINDLYVKLNNTNLNLCYENGLEYIKNNFEIAKKYSKNYSKRVEEVILDHIKNNIKESKNARVTCQ